MSEFEKVYDSARSMASGYESSALHILRNMRESIRADLLEMYPDISGPDIACAMDEALCDVWGPVDNYS